MKVRDYLCSDCGYFFEKFVKHDSDKVECPKCGSLNTQSTLSASSFKVTGEGAYTQKMKV